MTDPDQPARPPQPNLAPAQATVPPGQLWQLTVTAEAEVIPGEPKED